MSNVSKVMEIGETLDKWSRQLLDMTKNNKWLNCKDDSKTIAVLSPDPDVLFKEVDGDSISFEVSFVDEGYGFLELKKESPKQRTPKEKQKNRIYIHKTKERSIAQIKKESRDAIEEKGVNVAYLAFGSICWQEDKERLRAPVLFVPIRLEKKSVMAPYVIHTDDEVIVNPSFSCMLENDYGEKLPKYDGEGLTNYLEKVEELVRKVQWTVTKECKIGVFSFNKIQMYRDIKDNKEIILTNTNVRRLLGESPDIGKRSGGNSKERPLQNPLVELHNVLDADSSQIEAIEMAKSGKSFVLQGPPGTGKSQTITNIIAECLIDAKKVLFVSEKIAALNVVYEKLRECGLAEFCLQLYDNDKKLNKRNVVANICHTLDLEAPVARANDEVDSIEKEIRRLDSYANELHKKRPVIEKSLFELYEAYARLRSKPIIEWFDDKISSKGKKYLEETTKLLEQYVEYIPSIGNDYRKYPWFGYRYDDTEKAQSEVRKDLTAAKQSLSDLIDWQRNIVERYGIQCSSITDARVWSNIFSFFANSRIITPWLLDKKIFIRVNSDIDTFKSLSLNIRTLCSELEKEFNDDIYNLDGNRYHEKLTRQFGEKPWWLRWFSSEYRQLITKLRTCKKNGKRIPYDEAVKTMEYLKRYQERIREYDALEEEKGFKKYLGADYKGFETDWGYVIGQMVCLKSYNHISFGKLGNLDFSSEREAFEDYCQKIIKALTTWEEVGKRIAGYFDAKILDIESEPSSQLLERFDACLNKMRELRNWRQFRDLLDRLNEKQTMSYLHKVIAEKLEPKQIVGAFQKQFYLQWIDEIWEKDLKDFNRISLDQAVRMFSEKDKKQFECNRAKIRAELSKICGLFNKEGLEGWPGLRELREENQKKQKKQKSIRAILDIAGETVYEIKRCVLTSPLNVATYLEPKSDLFDVVIFDEASQIRPQEAISAIYRGKQLIVVGDPKQMPPTNFFEASNETEYGDEETADVKDFESILDKCLTFMSHRLLRWHYRSRSERLIAFSNCCFYDSELVTFPSSKEDGEGSGVNYFYVEDGVYGSGINVEEAKFIVDLIYQNIEKYPEQSLGVITFSEAQQKLIDELLLKRRIENKEKDWFFNDDRDEPFFIKNLENVQGVERDRIIMSITYGKNVEGRFYHYFGPLNKEGGERRLNVAITRAKCNVQVVSSMHYSDIDVARVSNNGPKLLRKYLDYAENGNIALKQDVSVNNFDRFDSPFEEEVCEFLRKNKFTIDTQVGCSHFRIDLALKRPDSSDYVLAIECDGATYHRSKNARDRDRLRQKILEDRGWKFYRIWSTSWYKDNEGEKKRLLEAANQALKAK